MVGFIIWRQNNTSIRRATNRRRNTALHIRGRPARAHQHRIGARTVAVTHRQHVGPRLINRKIRKRNASPAREKTTGTGPEVGHPARGGIEGYVTTRASRYIRPRIGGGHGQHGHRIGRVAVYAIRTAQRERKRVAARLGGGESDRIRRVSEQLAARVRPVVGILRIGGQRRHDDRVARAQHQILGRNE